MASFPTWEVPAVSHKEFYYLMYFLAFHVYIV